MKTSHRLIALAATLFIAMAATAQNLYDASGGTIIGKIANNTIYDASGGYSIGKINGERIMDGSGGRTLNHIKSDGKVMDSSGGYVVGYIRSNGAVMDKSNGRALGYVENGNVYDSSHGTKIGQYRGVDPKYVAYYYFFFPNRKSTTATTKKPANTAPQKVTDALTPRPKGVVVYDRDMRAMGTLWDADRFVSSVTNGFVFYFKKTEDGTLIQLHEKYFANVGKDNKTIYCNNGKDVYGIIDEKGNAYTTDGRMFGEILPNGDVVAHTKAKGTIPYGHVKDKDADRHMLGILYFVCYYDTLWDIYEKLDKQKAQKDSIAN